LCNVRVARKSSGTSANDAGGELCFRSSTRWRKHRAQSISNLVRLLLRDLDRHLALALQGRFWFRSWGGRGTRRRSCISASPGGGGNVGPRGRFFRKWSKWSLPLTNRLNRSLRGIGSLRWVLIQNVLDMALEYGIVGLLWDPRKGGGIELAGAGDLRHCQRVVLVEFQASVIVRRSIIGVRCLPVDLRCQRDRKDALDNRVQGVVDEPLLDRLQLLPGEVLVDRRACLSRL